MKRHLCHPCFAQLLLPTLGMLLLVGCSTAKGRLGGTLTSDDAVNTHSFVVLPEGAPQRREADNASSSPRGPEAGVGYSLTAADRPPSGSSIVLLARQCDEHIRYAFSLAERGAAYSAREEFIEALQLVSGALDADNGTQMHSRALKAGLRALKEADDFAPRQLRHETELDFTHLTATHQTPVLKGVDKTRLKPIDALQSYYAFATQQLARAGGDEPAASLALYGLGRVEAASYTRPSAKISMGGPKAIALHQAALMVNPQNHMAANELGVLLARYGQMKDAKVVLLHSLSASPQPETWHNLAIVHQKLGELEQARQARMNYESLTAVNRTRRDRAGQTRRPDDEFQAAGQPATANSGQTREDGAEGIVGEVGVLAEANQSATGGLRDPFGPAKSSGTIVSICHRSLGANQLWDRSALYYEHFADRREGVFHWS